MAKMHEVRKKKDTTYEMEQFGWKLQFAEVELDVISVNER